MGKQWTDRNELVSYFIEMSWNTKSGRPHKKLLIHQIDYRVLDRRHLTVVRVPLNLFVKILSL